MAVPDGYIYSRGAYWKLADGTGPYGVDSTGNAYFLSGFLTQTGGAGLSPVPTISPPGCSPLWKADNTGPYSIQ